MAYMSLGPDDALYVEHTAPTRPGLPTFVFVNALTGSTAAWEGEVAPALRAAGFGTLAYDFRGQAGSTYGPQATLSPAEIVADLQRLMQQQAPTKPVLVGLSIGGLFAVRSVLDGTEAAGLVLLNTLRRPGLRLDWINEAMLRVVRAGGFAMLLDAFLPMLVDPAKLADLRPNRLGADTYEPAGEDDPGVRLMREGATADWDLPYEELALPTLVVTGRQDRVFLVPEDVAALAARLPDARTAEIADAGHLIPMERPQALIELLDGFGRDIAAPAG